MSGVAFKNAAGTFTTNVIVPEPTANTTVTLPATGTVATVGNSLTLMTAQNSTSGTSIDFTGIPSWAKRITVMFNGVSTNGTSLIQIQIGTSGGIESTSYIGNCSADGVAGGYTTSTTSFALESTAYLVDTTARYGVSTILNINSNSWVLNGTMATSSSTYVYAQAGSKTLSATLDRIRITTVNGTDTFDAGLINVMYEG